MEVLAKLGLSLMLVSGVMAFIFSLFTEKKTDKMLLPIGVCVLVLIVGVLLSLASFIMYIWR